jgi:hypothetical protein
MENGTSPVGTKEKSPRLCRDGREGAPFQLCLSGVFRKFRNAAARTTPARLARSFVFLRESPRPRVPHPCVLCKGGFHGRVDLENLIRHPYSPYANQPKDSARSAQDLTLTRQHRTRPVSVPAEQCLNCLLFHVVVCIKNTYIRQYIT